MAFIYLSTQINIYAYLHVHVTTSYMENFHHSSLLNTSVSVRFILLGFQVLIQI